MVEVAKLAIWHNRLQYFPTRLIGYCVTLPDWRPRVHFTAQRHWINDPNGLVWHDGEYHLFFQHNPHDRVWGHMSWGHAVSTDLVHWQELPLAIPEDDDWMIFSGSVVVDQANTSGFGDGQRAAMVAIYTGSAQRPDATGIHVQNQQLAFSLDRGRTWTKHAGNPVLDLGIVDFRDPKVFWHEPDRCWIMLVSMAAQGRLRFYRSPDLKQWQLTSEFTQELPGCRLWECPDLLVLPVIGEPGRQAWLLKFDVFEGHLAGGSGAVGIVGSFDGSAFVGFGPPQWLDGGRDFYAAIAFGAMPPGDERRVWLGWMNDHHYANATPATPWCGAMSLPRSVQLKRDGHLWQILQQPVAELQGRRGPAIEHGPAILSATPLTLSAGSALQTAVELDIEVAGSAGGSWSLDVACGQQDFTRITVDSDPTELRLDRSRSGWDIGQANYASEVRMPWTGARASASRLRVIIDACSVEVFAGDGECVITSQIFPGPGSTGIRLTAQGPAQLLRATIWPL